MLAGVESRRQPIGRSDGRGCRRSIAVMRAATQLSSASRPTSAMREGASSRLRCRANSVADNSGNGWSGRRPGRAPFAIDGPCWPMPDRRRARRHRGQLGSSPVRSTSHAMSTSFRLRSCEADRSAGERVVVGQVPLTHEDPLGPPDEVTTVGLQLQVALAPGRHQGDGGMGGEDGADGDRVVVKGVPLRRVHVERAQRVLVDEQAHGEDARHAGLEVGPGGELRPPRSR